MVTHVGGTLTESEDVEFWSALGAARSRRADPGAAEALAALAGRGYDVVFIATRPEWLVGCTRHWLASQGFPPRLVRTTLGHQPLVGVRAQAFKSEELRSLASHPG